MEPSKLLESLLDAFEPELGERLAALNHALVALERSRSAREGRRLLDELLREAHSLKGASRSVGFRNIERVFHALESLFGRWRDARAKPARGHFAVLFAALDAIEQAGGRLRTADAEAGLAEWAERLETADAKPDPSPARAPKRARADSKRISERPAEARVRLRSERVEALGRGADELSNLRIRLQEAVARASAALDSLPDRAGGRRLQAELRARMLALHGAAAPLERELRSLNMVPFADCAPYFERALRDVAQERGKRVELEFSFSGVEVERTVFEGLRDPILHLLRNAVAHGVETPEARAAAGKPAAARVRIAAVLRGSMLRVSVVDDGGGVDLDEVRRRAAARGAVLAEDAHGDFDLLFRPGVSTASKVDAVAGRGVGLDAVKSIIEGMHGRVSVESRPGEGASFHLEVPCSLSTFRAVIVEAARRRYAIASASVLACVSVDAGRLRRAGGRPVFFHREAPIPVARLAAVLGLSVAGGERRGLVLGDARRRALLLVDAILGEEEIVSRPLSKPIDSLPLVAGAASSGGDRATVILKPAPLLRAASERTDAAPEPAVPALRRARRLLVVDDSLTTRSLEKSILEASGYEVVTAEDGESAWNKLSGDDFDGVVTDVEMPRLDGFGLARRIRAQKRFRALPVVLLTALERPEDRRRGLEAGADAYLTKGGFDQRQLLETLARLLGAAP